MIHDLPGDSRKETWEMRIGCVESLVDALLALDEPWRSRFLDLTANIATGWTWNEPQPGREELVTWLTIDEDLSRKVRLLVSTWEK
jgi:hypothetical protein